MAEKNCVVLCQNRSDSDYNDFIGQFYHFPNSKYLKLLSKPDTEFIYFEPESKGKGEGVYFGYGRIESISTDKKQPDHSFAKIVGYRKFSKPVSFLDGAGSQRESGTSYNAQNSVRTISPELLSDLCLDGGIILGFRADAHLIRVLGEQLIATESVGILELVKNAYDARATLCTVRIERLPGFLNLSADEYKFSNLEGPVVVVEDDGIGMSPETIEHGWLRPASPLKTSVKELLKIEKEKAIQSGSLGTLNTFVRELKKQHGGRLPLGEKGVGRFAAHKLGKNLVLKTKRKENDYELVLNINWDEFDKIEGDSFVDLESVGVVLSRQAPSRDYGKSGSGTQLVIFGGRPGFELTSEAIHNINSALLSLKSPHEGPDNFRVEFECPQVDDLDSGDLHKEFEPSLYFDGVVNADGIAEFELKMNPPKSIPLSARKIERKSYDLRLQDADDKDFWKGAGSNEDELRKPACGQFYLRINAWYRKSPWIDGENSHRFKTYLEEYGGISIYRDGLMILPAELGSELDWLRISTRHIKKGINISYYNMIGYVDVNQVDNQNLIDKTDRQGMLRNQAFGDLAALVRNAVFFVEQHFKAMREEVDALDESIIREPRVLKDVAKLSRGIIERIPDSGYSIVKDPLQLLKHLGLPSEREERIHNLGKSLKGLEKSLEAMQNVQELLTEQAGFGIGVAVAVHEIAKITSNFYSGVSKILKAKTFDEANLQKLLESSDSLKTELRRFAPLRAIRNEEPSVFDVSKAIGFCTDSLSEKFEDAGIQLSIETKKGFPVLARYGAINQIVTNLLDNSLYWVSMQPKKERKITIQIRPEERSIVLADSGPGIDSSIRSYLFQPGYSLRIPPSGLGLYICRHYMKDIGGDIYEASQRHRIPEISGAQFVLDFERVPAKREGAR